VKAAAAARQVAAAPRRIGRFELRRELGRGAQGSVWLAHDPRLDREVALKLLDTAHDSDALRQWLQEARAVSRLNHPHIVPVFEADDQGGTPCLVFEYVPGPTLAQARRQRPRWPAREAAQLMVGVLDALAAAHDQGIVHRDLKPSNVLLGQDGRPRVMDFGIAARVGADATTDGAVAGDGLIVGTPGYISPEAARGEAPVPAMDVFAAGVMLGELLAGAPLLRETDPMRALQRVQEEDLALPEALELEETLRGIVQRALARDRRARYDSAGTMRAALLAWLQPQAEPAPASAGHGTLDFLLRRMRHKTDFPALSQSVVRIQRVATSDTETLASLSDAILKDVALTNKLLRMVNTAHFKHAAGGGVSTISRAVALVGFAGIRNMALSLVLLEHMNDKAHAAHLKDEFLRALMAGTLASELTPVARETEEAFLGAMFQNLGRLLSAYYFPEEALQIRQRLEGGPATPARREAVAAQVLGLTLDELGAGVARHWGLPDHLQRAMRPPEGEPPSRRLDRGLEHMRWLGRGANAMTDALLAADGEEQARGLAAVAEAYAPALGLQQRQMLQAAQDARRRLSDLAQAMGLGVSRQSVSQRLLRETVAPGALVRSEGGLLVPAHAQPGRAATGGTAGSPHAGAVPGTTDTGAADEPAQRWQADDQTLVLPTAAGAGAAPGGTTASAQLAQGLHHVSVALAQPQARINDVLHLVLQTMQAALGLRRVVFGLRDSTAGAIKGRFGVGEGAPAICAALHVPLTGPAVQGSDLFATLCAKGADILIADTAAGTVAHRLPPWFRQAAQAPTFLMLPLMVNRAPVGLLYADKPVPGSIVVAESDLALLRALRDQVVLAFAMGKAGT
jgi:serine/threonine protein kinase